MNYPEQGPDGLRRYGIWAGNPKGYREDVTRCIEEVGGQTMWGPANARQCGRKRGHGPYYYHQTDPRGCALYVAREPLTDSDYTQGVAICA